MLVRPTVTNEVSVICTLTGAGWSRWSDPHSAAVLCVSVQAGLGCYVDGRIPHYKKAHFGIQDASKSPCLTHLINLTLSKAYKRVKLNPFREWEQSRYWETSHLKSLL